MDYRICKPSIALSSFVKHYWSIDNYLPADQSHVQRIVPNGLLELIFYFEDKPVSKSDNKSIDENSMISGQLKDYYDINISGKLSLFSILFKPEGLSRFTGIPINELFNQNIPLHFIFPNDIHKLENKLYEEKSFEGRIKIIETYLLKLLQKNGEKQNIERMEHTISTINKAKGLVDIDFLASESCFSRKQFERVFSNYIGTSPKQFLRIIRFQNAIHERAMNKTISLTELTYKCGYYDQSHMINDFQKLAGLSPKKFFNDCNSVSDYFN